MGSLVIKIDKQTSARLKNTHHYSDIDMFNRGKVSDGGVPMNYDVDAVRQSIRNILMWKVGESVIHPQFGHNIYRSMYEQLDDISSQKICSEVKRAIEDNEPRVEVQNVNVKRDDEDDDINNTIHVTVVYVVKGQENSEAKLVEQATISGK